MKNSRFKIILITLILLIPVISQASFHFKRFGISVFPAFSTDNMHRWFNTKFEFDWKINDWMELETSAVFLRVNTLHDPDIFYKELGLWGIMTNAKFKLPWNFYAGAGLGMHYTNLCHPYVYETYLKWKPNFNLSLEWQIPWKNPGGFQISKFEFMYFFIPINLKEYVYGKYYFANVFAVSIHFNIFGGK